MSGVSGEVFRAMSGAYGQSDGKLTTQAQRRHELLCSDGRYCENRDCLPGKAWRAAHNYKVREIDGEVATTLVQDGERPETATGKDGAKQAEGNRAVSLPVLPPADRTGTAETDAPAGTATRLLAAATADAKTRGTVAERIARLRERLRSG